MLNPCFQLYCRVTLISSFPIHPSNITSLSLRLRLPPHQKLTTIFQSWDPFAHSFVHTSSCAQHYRSSVSLSGLRQRLTHHHPALVIYFERYCATKSNMRITRPLLLLGSLLVLCLCVGCAAGAGIGDDIEVHARAVILDRRQENNSTSPATTPSSSPPPSASSPAPSTNTPTTSPTTSPHTTNTPTTSPKTTDEPTTQTPEPTTTPAGATTSPKKTTMTLKPTSSTRIITMVITTRIGTSDVASTMTSTTVDVYTPTAGLSTSGDQSTGSSGLNKTQKNVVIGVVVGVGGAILLGGLLIVFWRLKRARKNPVDEDDLMRRGGSPLAESGRDMHSSSTDASPFQATLDQYHRPPGQVNASSNF
ncbi:hypothetical protein BDD12DRAFT_521745 [Trichophaea hybrida]|nr:hypothetical protein BDD12DRAFT_521745 [Trichophaea hybrida]